MQHPIQRRTRRMSKALASGLVLALIALIAPGIAQADPNDRATTEEELARVRAELESKGYSDVHDLEVDDGRFEVEARNARGEEVDLELDVGSLAILHEGAD